jgi:hypothetical protein
MRNVSYKSYRENQNTYFNFFPKIMPFVEQYGTARQVTDDSVLRYMFIAYWILILHTHSEYVTLNSFPWQ